MRMRREVHRAIYIASITAVTVLLLANVLFIFNAQFSGKTHTMLSRSTQAVLAAASLASATYSQQVLDLSTVDWTLTSPNFSYISVPGKVPSQVHLDLQAAQVCTFVER